MGLVSLLGAPHVEISLRKRISASIGGSSEATLDLKHLPTAALAGGSRVAFWARRRRARHRESAESASAPPRVAPPVGRRNILLITSDQQRYDALGVNGGRVARTLALDALARSGINFRRAHVQNVVCMPSRSTILTGQHPLTHGVVANGIPLPLDSPSVAELLRAAGYRTALIGKAHFDPHVDPRLRFFENRCAAEALDGPWHGFEHMELATHGPVGGHHYAAWLWEHHRREVFGFGSVLSGTRGGDTRAPEVAHNPVPREHYHTDWVAERTRAWLAARTNDEPWFCWMSFPDPHHPFDPPFEEVRRRIDWRDVPLPEGHPKSRRHIEQILRQKPRHWLDWYEGRFRNPEGGPVNFIPGELSEAQLREINAMVHVENELIDEACKSVFSFLRERGLDQNTDVLFTSDHGELQGDFGLLFKGPYHVEALLRVPLIWRPAPVSRVAPADIEEPVGHVDLAPTLCTIAGLDVPDWMQGEPLPTQPGSGRERVLTTFDSQFAKVGMHLRTLYRDGYLCTAYGPTTHHVGGRLAAYWALWGRGTEVPEYLGYEGELYDLRSDPHQWENLWEDPQRKGLRNDLVADLRAHLPPVRVPSLRVVAPT